jgi:hypothetical protein
MDRRDELLVGDRFAARARDRDRLDSIDESIHRAFAGNDQGKTYLLHLRLPRMRTGTRCGCAVFQVTNLSNAAILRTPNGAPQMIKYVQGPANTPRGACTYTPHDTGSGINFAEISPGSSPPIQIVESLVQLP